MLDFDYTYITIIILCSIWNADFFSTDPFLKLQLYIH